MVWQQGAHKRVTCLMVGDELLRGVVREGTALQACDDAVSGVVDLVLRDGLLVPARREDGRFIHQILQISPTEARCALGNVHERDVLSKLLVLDVDLENLLTALDIWQAHRDTAVKTARPEECIVQNIRTVRRCHDDDAGVARKAIHLREDLVQGLLPLIIPPTHACTTLPPNGVNLIDEDNARCLLLGLLEDVAHARSSNANKELDELRCGGLHEWHAGLARQSLCHQSLAGTRGARE
mmetsp:Transcript_38632/g.92745  ORF Transcript_38632/g.92745 Transcript_38632/m.92745 type:complete len:239 (+) Transcript_38632:807-1523(+)